MLVNTMTAQRIAREYRRLSDERGGTSIARQGEQNRLAATENEWTLGEPYADDGISASRYARRRRDDFERLVADLESGPTGRTSRFGADILMLWESSRGSRQVGEWVNFIELLEQKGVLIWVTTHERLYDPRNGRDRKSLLEDAVDSEYESYKTHRRVTGTAAFEAQEGRPSGQAPYGLRAVYDEKTGDLLTWVEDTERSPMIKDLFEWLEKGVSLSECERRFAARGYIQKRGKPFSRAHIRKLAMRHAYAGLRYHKGEVYSAIWDALVPPERFWTVYRRLQRVAATGSKPGGAKHELTGALTCSVCGCARARVKPNKVQELTYTCADRGCYSIQKEPTDAFLVGSGEEPGLLLAYLARPDVYELLSAPVAGEAEVQEVRGDIARLRAELDELEQATADTPAEVKILANSVAKKEADLSRLIERERDITLPPSILSIIEPGRDVWDSWQRAAVSARREVISIVFSPQYLGRIHVRRSPKSGPNQEVIDRLEVRRLPAGVAGGR